MKKTFTKLKSLITSVAMLSCGITSVGVGQVTYTFTNAGATGRFGPSQALINTAYASTNLNGMVTSVSGIQQWTVPATGNYGFTVAGASAQSASGRIISFNYTLTAGQVLKILVGQMGVSTHPGQGSGGGGGSFVTLLNNTPIGVAGGAAGFANGATTTSGANGALTNGGAGGTNGGGGFTGVDGPAQSGAGIYGDGLVGGTGATVAQSFTNGGNGGAGGGGFSGNDGGFGGGGGAFLNNTAGPYLRSGGGGGYSGGGGGGYNGGYANNAGGGGGSFINVAAANSNTNVGLNANHGYVVIAQLYGVAISQTSSITCNGNNNAALSATVSGGQAPYTYTWLPSGGNASVAAGLAAGVYTLNVLDNNLQATSATYTITQPAVISGSLSSQINATCFGNTNGSATISANGGTSPYSYTWTPSGGTTAVASGLGAGVYTCTIGDNNNCPTAAVSVTITSPAAITGTATSLSVCNGNTVTLTGTGATSYTWSGGIINGVAFTPTATTAYTVVGSNSVTSCTGTAVLSVTVNPIPTISVSGATICTGTSTTLTPSGASTYTYSGGSAAVSPTATTVYTITGTSAAGCQASAITVTVVVNPCTGINEANADNNVISVYPNPSNGVFTIAATSANFKTVKVMDVVGKVIYSSQANANYHQIDITRYSNGIYHIVIETDKGTQIMKVVKE